LTPPDCPCNNFRGCEIEFSIMGLKKLILLAVVGPMIAYSLLMVHVIYQHGYKTPAPLSKPQWPPGTKEETKTSIITNRNFIIDDFKNVLANKLDYKKFLKTRCTNDVVWEDPLERIEGSDNVASFFKMVKYLDFIEYKVHNVVHSAHEILMDWDIKFGFKIAPSIKINLPMRTHIMMEPPEKQGSAEKIFRISEEWYGNEQITERNFKVVPYLGKIHQMLRQFTGTIVVEIGKLL